MRLSLFAFQKQESIKKGFLLMLVWLALGMIWAQTTIIDSTRAGGFELGSEFNLNGWATVGSSSANENQYICGARPTTHQGSYCAYIGYRTTNNYYYWQSYGNATYCHMYRDVTLGSSAEPVVTLSFWYKINNPSGSNADNGDRGPDAINGDGFRIYLAPITYIPSTTGYPSGAGVQQIGAWWYDGVTSSPDGTTIYSNGFNARSWTRMVVAIPRNLVGQQKRLIFTWRNDGDAPHYVGALDNISLTSKPLPGNPRFVAEWEQAFGACINWDYYSVGSPQGNKFGIPDGLIQALVREDSIYIFVQCDPGQVSACRSYLNGLGLQEETHYKLRLYPTDSYYAGDHGPSYIFQGDARSRARSMGVTRFAYNRDRPWDDQIGVKFGELNEYPYFCMPLVHTGGNIMTDGNGAAMSTDLVLRNNDGTYDPAIDHVVDYNYTSNEIKQIMQEYLGIEDYQIFEDPNPNDTYTVDRMDTWCKLLDVDRVMIRRVPPGHQDYAAIEAQAALWNNLVTSYQREAEQAGKPGCPYGFKIFRVDTPNNEPYTCSLIMNNTIFVPQMSSPASQTDLAAIAAYQNAMPAYTIKGYYYKPSDPWLSADALHNRVSVFHRYDMLHIWHVPLWGEVAEDADIVLPISITSHFDLIMNIENTHLSYCIWNADTGYSSWVNVPLVHTSGNNYTATIPATAFAAGDSIFYSIHAEAGCCGDHDYPLNGRLDPFRLRVADPTATPVELSSFTCGLSVDGFVNLNWVTQTETGLLGYYVFRNTEEDYASAELISPLIPGTNTSQQQSYMYSDHDLMLDETYYYYWLTSNKFDGTVNLYGPVSIQVDNSGGSSVPPIEIATGINKVYPNPFGSYARVTYSVAKDNSPVRLSVYNLRGELVRDLVSGFQGKDTYTTTWDCRDQQGKTCGNGVYLMVLKAGNESYVKRTILIK